MKILLVGYYPYLRSQSMDRFAEVLRRELAARGHDVRLLRPTPFLGRLIPSPACLGKWLWYVDRFLLFLPFLMKQAIWADVVHFCDHAGAVYVPWLKNRHHVVTCHDLIAVRSALGELREYRTGVTGKIYQHWILASLKRAQKVTCVSEATRQDVLRLTGLRPEKVLVIKNGLNFPYKPMPRQDALRHLRDLDIAFNRPFLLHVGGNFNYKNREGLFRLFAQFLRLDGCGDYHLVLAGAGMDDKLQSLSQELGIERQVREAGEVTNEQLCALYSTAEALVFPSLHEGFGWPIVEAQACGCPVFTTNRRPMSEVGGDGALYFDPADEATAARIVLEGLKRRKQPVVLGFRNAEKYKTEAMIDGYLACYESLLNH